MDNIALELCILLNRKRRFNFPFEAQKSILPKNGIYIIFENGEMFNDLDRIVRVGTHTGDNQLFSRLKQHFVEENKNRSILRKNIGRCLLNKNGSPYLPLWELDITSREEKERNLRLLDLEFEKQIEKQITNYIQTNLSFCVFEVGTKEQRIIWESKIVSTIVKATLFKSSATWLGNYSPKEKIKSSGLWQVNELYNEILTTSELNELKSHIGTI